MHLIIDTHLHFYPCYDLSKALNALRINLLRLDSNAVYIGILAERSDCHFFKEMYENSSRFLTAGLKVIPLKGAILLKEDGFGDIYLLPGRQIVTSERIEMLCLLRDIKIDDGLLAQEVINIIRMNKGVPVLSWSPGKWFFKRGKIVRKLILSNPPGSMLLGDTTSRPVCWPKPNIMKNAEKKGFVIISGSDPLPFSGDENMMGRYATLIKCDFDTKDPDESLRSFLLQPGIKPSLVGKRNNIFSLLYRMFKHSQLKTD
jgi:hypothetical protein